MAILVLPQLFSAGLQQMQRAQVGCGLLFAAVLDPAALEQLQKQRLQRLVAHARCNSPLHAARLQGLSTHDEGRLTALPILRRSDLMNDFEAGLCAPHPSADEIKVWLAEPARVGARIEDRWQVWESSGTQGQPGWFVQDEAALAVYDALESLRGAGASAWDTLSGGHRMALLVATGGHFASIASFERLRREAPWMAERMRAFSILQPLPALVQALNDWQPSVLATYPTAATLLAEQARAGHLNLRLRALWSGGETLRPAQRARIEAAFDCPVRNSYGASEFFCIASECGHGGLHLNADWVILEPVDAEGQPVPIGDWGQTTLLTNLANHVQPLIRYELGDRVRFTGSACACGNRLPLIEVQGREDEVLHLRGADGSVQGLLPLALSTLIEDEAGVFDYQLVQSGPSSLRLQLPGGDRTGAARARTILLNWLAARGLSAVRVQIRLDCPPLRGRSGKLQRVLGASSRKRRKTHAATG
jgi:phenylacetate-coenzyme A ligase PaaK-like adenylate-forming protein